MMPGRRPISPAPISIHRCTSAADDEVREAIFTTGKAAYIDDYARADGTGAGRRAGRLGRPPMGETTAGTAAGTVRADHAGQRPDLRRHRLSGGTFKLGDRDCGSRFPETGCPRTHSRREVHGTASRSLPNWCARYCTDNEPTGSRRSSLSHRGSRRGRVGGLQRLPLHVPSSASTDERIAYADGWFAEAHDDTTRRSR